MFKRIFIFSLLAISLLQAEFIRNDNLAVVLDTSTNLIWENGLNAKDNTYTWQKAKNYCDNLILGEVDDWYLPSRDEYHSIMTAFYGQYDTDINWQNSNINLHNWYYGN